MIRLLVSILVFNILSFAHEAQENRAKIGINHGSVYLNLSIHSSDWTKSFAVHELDDVILEDTKLTINNKLISLKLKRIQKSEDHYSIQYLANSSINSKINSTSLTLPKQLGDVIVTVVRATTKLSLKGQKVLFSFK